jgi:Flp pilus assembly protein TadD
MRSPMTCSMRLLVLSAAVFLASQPLDAQKNDAAARRAHAATLRLEAQQLQKEHPAEAITLLHLALATDPASGENSVALGDSYAQAERYDEAIPFFERALELLPQEKQAIYGRLAQAYVGTGDEAAAVRVLRAARLPESRITHNLARYRQSVSRP